MPRLWTTAINRGIEGRAKKEDIIGAASKEELFNIIHDKINELIDQDPIRLSVSAPKIENIDGLFAECNNLRSVELNRWDLPKCKSMKGLFSGCENLEKVVFKECNFSEVESMRYMFSGCKKLTSIQGIDNLNVSNHKDMEGMFDDCPDKYKKEGDKLIKENK